MKKAIVFVVLSFFFTPMAFAFFGGSSFGTDRFGQGTFEIGAFGEKTATSGGSTPDGALLYQGDTLTYNGDSLTYNP